MTDDQPTTPTEAAELPSDATDAQAGGDDQGAEQPPDHDAARYRRQLRETEAESAGLRTKLETLQRNQVEAMASTANVAVPATIWAGGLKVEDLLGDDGMVDEVKAKDAIADTIMSMGLATRSVVRPDMSQGSRGAADPAVSFAALLRGDI